jgi:predicted flap endonuclease-1-like 5' DNA nuclease
MDWWVILIIVLVILFVLFLIWWFSRPKKEAPPQAPLKTPEPVAVAPKPPALPDNLEIIEGIGPKISSVLQAAGVTTFKQLAALEAAKISEILANAGVRLADPATWPEQARLAAEGKMEALKTLQDSLKGGRKE